jgi:hypothetical protein
MDVECGKIHNVGPHAQGIVQQRMAQLSSRPIQNWHKVVPDIGGTKCSVILKTVKIGL